MVNNGYREVVDTIKEKLACEPLLLGLGGSHAYGTNIETSDLDIRGVYLNSRDELLGIEKDKEQMTLSEPDTVVYSLKKFVRLAADCNPNVIELLGLRQQDYLYTAPLGAALYYNRKIFLSKKAITTFGGYAKSQLNRLINKRGRRTEDIPAMEQRSLQKVMDSFQGRYKDILVDDFSAELDDDNQIICNMTFRDMPLERIISMTNELINVDKDYRKSERNEKAEAHGKIAKHMMHLLRLYMMGIDLLKKCEIITYRADEHDLLMAIRRGEYLEGDGCTPTKEFERLLEYFNTEFYKAAANTKLPDDPNWAAINELLIRINSEVLK